MNVWSVKSGRGISTFSVMSDLARVGADRQLHLDDDVFQGDSR
jgi:hypothetical protein